MPSLKPREVLEILFAAGFKKIRTSGSHIRLVKNSRFVTVPFHSRSSIPKGTLQSILRQSGLSREEFLKISRKSKL